MNEIKLRTIAQLEEFLKATSDVSFSGIDSTEDNNICNADSRIMPRPSSATG